MKKIWIFRTIALLIPFFFFAFLELTLRVFGVGDDYPLFIENPQAPQYLLPRPDIVKKYFPPGADTPAVTIETNFFKKDKPENGIRIFVQGGSTAAGFPFGLGASIAGMLDYRLKQSYPDRPVEVISTALSAVNSFTLLDFSDEIIAHKPDAVLIYAGHNEYLGILGVGSSYTVAGSYESTLIFLKLRKLRMFQLLQRAYWSFFTPDKSETSSNARTTMAKIARHKNIPKDSDIYRQGIRQFERNMSLLLKKYTSSGIPVFVSTIASNLGDQKPFKSTEFSGEDAKTATRFRLTGGENNSQSFLEDMERFARTHSDASTFYALGQRYLDLGKAERAKNSFVRARDHDLLRFRAPSDMNVAIRALASDHGAFLVDANAALEAQSPEGIINQKFMLEHLHPTLDGYFVIADAFYRALAMASRQKDSTVNATNILPPFTRIISSEEAREEIPIFPAEEFWGLAKIADLKSDYPFVDTKQKPQLPPIKTWSDRIGYKAYRKELGWLEIATQTLKNSGQNTKLQAVTLKLISDALPHHAGSAYQAGTGLIRLGRAIEAPRYLHRAIDLDKTNTNYQLALVHALLLQQRIPEAQTWVRSILSIDPSNKMALEVQKKTEMASP